MEEQEVMVELYRTDKDCDIYLAAFGTVARICKSVIDMAEEEGIKVGLVRPITLFPFPKKQISEIASKGKKILTIELNAGQMVEDVRLAVNGRCETPFYGRMGGMVPTDTEIFTELKKQLNK
jgi:2-oxoglutarate ferredoxin oxidoreductase subunit alpha